MECHAETTEPAFQAATAPAQSEAPVVEPDFRPEPSGALVAVRCDCRGGGGGALPAPAAADGADTHPSGQQRPAGIADRTAAMAATKELTPGAPVSPDVDELIPGLDVPRRDVPVALPEYTAVRSVTVVPGVECSWEDSKRNCFPTRPDVWADSALASWSATNVAVIPCTDGPDTNDGGDLECSLDTCALGLLSDSNSDFSVASNDIDPVNILKQPSNYSEVNSASSVEATLSSNLVDHDQPMDMATGRTAVVVLDDGCGAARLSPPLPAQQPAVAAPEQQSGAPRLGRPAVAAPQDGSGAGWLSRPSPGQQRRRVSFPDGDVSLVSGYIEPRNPLGAMYNASAEVIAAAYRQSCLRHGSRPLASVLRQIAALPLLGDRVQSFSLRGLCLDRAQCESLEEVLKKVQFHLVDVSGCGLDDDSAAALFEMVEFYDSALSVSFGGSRLGVRGWQACCRMVKASASLERLSAEGVELYDQSAASLGRSLRLSSSLRVLHLEGCRLHGRPMALLIAGLKQSPTLKELYLGENELGTGDGSMLGNMLKLNLRLDLVDLRINHFDNDSVSFLLEALMQQPVAGRGDGLASLNLWHNRFSVKSAGCLAALLARHKSLETLNLGRNALGDETVRKVKEALMANMSLRWLGLQECSLTCEGAVALAEILAGNAALQRVDLRGNRIGVGGLLALTRALEHNACLIQLDLDAAVEPERLLLHARLRDLCEANRQRGAASDDETPLCSDTLLRRLSAALRRVSLTCDAPAAAAASQPSEERRRLLSPSPSPTCSPLPSPCRSRFRVFRVPPGSPPVPAGLLQRPPRSDSESDASSPGPSPVRRAFRVTAVSSAPTPSPHTGAAQ